MAACLAPDLGIADDPEADTAIITATCATITGAMSDDLDLELDSCFPTPENTFQKIDSSLRLLQQVNSAHVSLSGVFLRPLYKNTGLERTIAFGGVQHDNEDSSLRKNLYLLASNLKNPINFIIQLVQRGVLSLDEKDAIMRHENEHLKNLVTFVYLVKKDASLFSKVLDALNVTQNDKISGMLKDANTLPAARTETITPLQHAVPDPTDDPLPFPDGDGDEWECINCTFINNSATNVCDICFKTKDFKDTPTTSSLVCPKCTFINPVGVNLCAICEFEIVPKPNPAVPRPSTEGNGWSDDDDDDDD